LEEKVRPGRFSVDRAEALGVPSGPLYSRLQEGEAIRVGDRTVRPEDVLGPPRRGRKIVYTGDTMPHEALVEIAHRADVLIEGARTRTPIELLSSNNDSDLHAASAIFAFVIWTNRPISNRARSA